MNADFLAVLEFWEREKGINREILVGKWLGAVSSARWLLGLLAVVWLLSFFGEGLSIAAPFLLLVCLAVYAAFMATLGLLFGIIAIRDAEIAVECEPVRRHDH